MKRLGYTKHVAQGSDWRALTTQIMGAGIHRHPISTCGGHQGKPSATYRNPRRLLICSWEQRAKPKHRRVRARIDHALVVAYGRKKSCLKTALRWKAKQLDVNATDLPG
jgi:hypothetical protein